MLVPGCVSETILPHTALVDKRRRGQTGASGSAGVLFVLVSDIVITGRIEGPLLASTGQMFFVALLAGWILVQLYALPLLFEQEQPSVRLALRNAAIMLIRHPAFSVALGALVAFLLVISTLLVILTALAGGMFVALAGNHAVLSRLPDQ